MHLLARLHRCALTRLALGVGQSNAEAVLERMSSQEPPVLPDAVRLLLSLIPVPCSLDSRIIGLRRVMLRRQVSYTSVVDAHAKSANFAAASAAVEAMRAAGFTPGIVTVGACLNAAKKAADPSAQGVQIVREAHALFEGLEASERNDFVYSAMIMALGAAGMKEEAVRLFEEAAGSLQPWCGAPIDA